MRLDRDQPPHTHPLPEDARNLWPFFVDEVVDRGYGNRVAPHRLAIYVQIFAQYLRVTNAINTDGQISIVRNDKGEVKSEGPSAETLLQNKHVLLLRSFDKEFGFLEESSESDPFAGLAAKLNSRMAQVNRED